jgi:hypothetical protein
LVFAAERVILIKTKNAIRWYSGDHDTCPRPELFIAYRRILLFIAMYESVAAKPAWRESWKRMILDQPRMAAFI